MAAYIVTRSLQQSKLKWHDKSKLKWHDKSKLKWHGKSKLKWHDQSRAYRSLRHRSSCTKSSVRFPFLFFKMTKTTRIKRQKMLTMIKCILAADAMCFWITSFRKMISVSFIVISSSFLELYSIGYNKYSKSRMKHKHKQTNENTQTHIIRTHVHMQTHA